MRRGWIIYVMSLFLVISLVGAVEFFERESFKINENKSYVVDDYYEGDVVLGGLNISFKEQENGEFTSSFGEESIMLLDLLNKSGYERDIDYSCLPVGCNNNYKTFGKGEREKDIHLSEKGEVYGFYIEDEKQITGLEDIEFTLVVNSYVSACKNQFYVDMFDDGTKEFFNNKPYNGNFGGNVFGCGHEYGKDLNFFYRGCFEEDEDNEYIGMKDNYFYCEYFKEVPPSGTYYVETDLKITEGKGDIVIFLLPLNSSESPIGSVYSGSAGELNAKLIINYTSIDYFDALICAAKKGDDDFEVEILSGSHSGSCGLALKDPSGDFSKEDFVNDYAFSLKPVGFGSVQEIKLDNDLYEELTGGGSLVEEVSEYLDETYGFNCSEGCVVPFRVGGVNQNGQKIKSAKLEYETEIQEHEVDEIFEIIATPVRITSDFLEIDLADMGFSVPNYDGEHDLRIYLGGKKILEEEIEVDIGFDFHVKPLFGYVGRDVYFKAESDAKGVDRSVWDFGDGTPKEEVEGVVVKHRYPDEGVYRITVTLFKGVSNKSSVGSTKRFKVSVGEPRRSAELTIEEYESKIEKIESAISKYPLWIGKGINESIDFDRKKKIVEEKRDEFDELEDNAEDSSYISIINDLMEISLPNSFYTSSSGKIPIDAGFNFMDVSQIEEITEDEIKDVEGFKSEMVYWMNKHYDVEIDYEEIAASGDFANSSILTKYKVDFKVKEEPDDSAYLVIGLPKETLVFASEDEKFASTSVGGTYSEITSSSGAKGAEFYIAGSNAPGAEELGVYISPSKSALGITGLSKEDITECWHSNCDEEGNFLWGRFLIGMGALLLFFFAIYLVLQMWYKRHYEHYLFKNPNDLYNLLNFIYNSRRNNMKDSKIKESLKQKKWSSEQITYAFRKLEGKRTGMWEIPIFKFLENNKVRRELKKKQGGGKLNTRFIKRPNL